MDKQKNKPPDNRKLSAVEQQFKAVNEQLKATNQQLRASQQQLRAANQQLQAGNRQLRTTEEKLRNSRKRYKAMFEGTIDAIAVYEAADNGNDFIFRNLNLAAEKIEKVRSEEILGKSVLEVLPAVKEFGLFDVFQRVLKTGKDERFSQTIHKEGRITGWRVNHIFKLPSGEIVAIYKDITERKRAQELLTAEHNLLRTLIDNLPDSIYIKDTQSRFVISNVEIARRVGAKTPDELIGKTDNDFHPKELASKYYADEQQVIRSGRPLLNREEQVIDHTTGETMWNLTTKVPWRDSHGEIVGIIGIGRNITDRKRAEEALQAANQQLRASEQQLRATNQQLDAANQQLRASEQQLRAANQQLEASNQQLMANEKQLRQEREKAQKYLDVAATIMVVIEPDQKVTLINKKGCEILGYGEEEILGRNWFDNFTPQSVREQTRASFQQFMAGAKELVKHNERPVLTKSKQERIIAWHNAVLTDEDGNIVSLLASGTDITERKQAEEKLRDYQGQLKSLASQLSLTEELERRRIAIELHDRISQFLVISKVKLETLCESAPGELAKAISEVCDSLDQTIQNTRLLTSDLSSPILYELGFEAAVSEWLAEQIQQKHGITTEFEDDGQSKPLDENIRVLLFRDVRELLINVVKHAQAHKVKVSVRKVGGNVHVSVEDDGVGFDFAEVSSIASKTGGFGLFSIRERLEQLEGYLEVESKPGHGTRVTLIAPLKHEEDQNTVS